MDSDSFLRNPKRARDLAICATGGQQPEDFRFARREPESPLEGFLAFSLRAGFRLQLQPATAGEDLDIATETDRAECPRRIQRDAKRHRCGGPVETAAQRRFGLAETAVRSGIGPGQVVEGVGGRCPESASLSRGGQIMHPAGDRQFPGRQAQGMTLVERRPCGIFNPTRTGV